MSTLNSQQQQQRIRTCFNRSARTYDSASVLQQAIADDLLTRSDFITVTPESILDLGCGTGYLTRLLQSKYRRADIVGIDLADSMLELAKQRNTWRNKQYYACADAYQLPFADNSFDCVFSNLMLQWCEDLTAVFFEIQRVLKPQGLLMFSTFGPDTLKELKSAWRVVDQNPHTNQFTDMHDIGDILMSQRYVDPVVDMYPMILTYTSALALMRDLKNMGAQHVMHRTHSTQLTKARLHQLEKAYQVHQMHDGRIPATFEVICGHAWGADLHHSIDEQGVVQVPLAQIAGLKRSSS